MSHLYWQSQVGGDIHEARSSLTAGGERSCRALAPGWAGPGWRSPGPMPPVASPGGWPPTY